MLVKLVSLEASVNPMHIMFTLVELVVPHLGSNMTITLVGHCLPSLEFLVYLLAILTSSSRVILGLGGVVTWAAWYRLPSWVN